MQKNIAVILAAGTGNRFDKNGLPKQYRNLHDEIILNKTIKKFLQLSDIYKIFVVINKSHKEIYQQKIIASEKLEPAIIGGETRQESVFNALKHIEKLKPDNVLIHDAVRCLVSKKLITDVCDNLQKHKAVLPAIPVTDTLKLVNDKNFVINTIDRSNLWQAQTPQGFEFKTIFKAHKEFQTENLTDDIALIEKLGIKAKIILGNKNNLKITTKNDLELAEGILRQQEKQHNLPDIRMGFGYDVHRLEDGGNIKLCGISIPYNKKLKGHSDADVAMHALTDALLGSIGAKDIGHHFPPGDKKWQNANSEIFLKHALGLLKEKNAIINNIDITIICEEPKISPFYDEMVKNIARITNISESRINVKATTTEKLGFTGKKQGIAVNAIASVTVM